jgi:hypothetical protein
VTEHPATLNESYTPEKMLDPLRPFASKDAAPTLAWQFVPQDINGVIGFPAQMPGSPPASVYVLQRIFATEKVPVAILVGSSEPFRLWLNGKQAHERAAKRQEEVGPEAVPATLEAGWNTLVLRVVPGEAPFCSLRLANRAEP